MGLYRPYKINNKSKILLLDLLWLLSSRNLQSSNRASTPCSKHKNSSSISWCHLLQFSLQFTVVITRQFKKAPFQSIFHQSTIGILHTLLGLQLNIEFCRLP
ncbi:hypothetical protein OIU79_001897 [Salix purpurea]|uniref:Uncharacterized protein n=1 Tax=Salix purpurea TaxID=77065 RepID=A0A9Q0URG8_SALPP|nr:hypothetical protein OIU79_001897 [Salix purpurea]